LQDEIEASEFYSNAAAVAAQQSKFAETALLSDPRNSLYHSSSPSAWKPQRDATTKGFDVTALHTG
jgi:hypothetical protein